MRLIEILEAGRLDFLDAANGIPPEKASMKPGPSEWSVVECIEHVAAVESRQLSWIANGTAIEDKRDADKELRLFSTIRSRLTKVQSPDAVRPQGRFRSLAAALAEFEAVRERTIQLVQDRGEGLYAIGVMHPFFGAMNGAELVQMMDGHARRHADQVREIGETLKVPALIEPIRMKPATKKKAAGAKRDEPDLPAAFQSCDDPHGLFARADVAISEMRLQDLDRPNLKLDSFQIEGSALERVQLAGGQFGSAVWKDVRFTGCDLSNVRAHRLVLVRVEFVDCRLTGFRATDLDCRDVLIQNSDMRFAQMTGGKFLNCAFDGCNCEEADLQSADLTGCVLRSCNLAKADFHGAKLQKTDFRRSEVEGLLVGNNDLRGAIVDPAQAMIFAKLMGLQIA